jgi:signal transduction histidine kinase/ActR/RegA family two-component response regulator
MTNEFERLAIYTEALNKSLKKFISHTEETIDDVMSDGLWPIAEAASLDRIIVYRVWAAERHAAGEIYRWDKAKGGSTPVDEALKTLPVTETVKRWIHMMSDDSHISLKRSEFTEGEAAFLSPRGVQSILITPVFTEKKFWGVITFHDNVNERDFDDDCVALLRSASRLCASALIMEEKTKEAKEAAETLKYREKMLGALNEAAIMFLAQHENSFENIMTAGLKLIADELELGRIGLYRNSTKPDGLHASQIYRWDRELGGTTTITESLKDVLYARLVPSWERILGSGGTINSPVYLLSESAVLKSFGCVSAYITPVFMGNVFWGFVLFEDRKAERFFDDNSAEIMRSAAYLCANTVTMHEMIERQRDEGKRLERLVAERTEELNKATDEAKTASEAKSRFIANMSHEMRTPMNVIVGLTDLMLEEEDVSNNIKETLRKINTAGTTLTGLINDVLDISKVESGKVELIPVQYDMASFLNDIITLNIIHAEEKPVAFKLEIDENLPRILFGDDIRIKQILSNLLSNAFKYTKKGTVTLSVDCSYDSGGVWLSFCISDTGIGIRTEDMAKLFSDYNQVDTRANRKIEGTGLGLSITKKFVELMGGEITVESEYGKGTTFRARIRQGFVTDAPIAKETVENLRSFHYTDKKKQAQEKLVRSDLSYVRVLVVDDFRTNLDVAAGMLRKYKMQVDCVTSGQEAVDLIATGIPVYDAVFMDHMMPEMDGMEATRLIRALGTDYAKNIPIIALTANAVAGNERMFLDNGFNAFLPKPVNVMNLDAVIQKWVRNKTKEK